MLLLGYAAEMFLKSALVRVYIGCDIELFDREIRRFGHDYKSLAEAVAFPMTREDEEKLDQLRMVVTDTGRYPIPEHDPSQHTEKRNERYSFFWSSPNYDAFLELAMRLRQHAQKVQGSSDTPLKVYAKTIDDDGYMVVRVGGRLPARLTFRGSSWMRENGFSDAGFIRSLIIQEDSTAWPLHYLGNIDVFEDVGTTPNKRKLVPRFQLNSPEHAE